MWQTQKKNRSSWRTYEGLNQTLCPSVRPWLHMTEFLMSADLCLLCLSVCLQHLLTVYVWQQHVCAAARRGRDCVRDGGGDCDGESAFLFYLYSSWSDLVGVQSVFVSAPWRVPPWRRFSTGSHGSLVSSCYDIISVVIMQFTEHFEMELRRSNSFNLQ